MLPSVEDTKMTQAEFGNLVDRVATSNSVHKDTPLVPIRVYPDDASLAAALSVETGMSVAEVIRHALNDLNYKDPLPEKWVWVQRREGT